MIRGLFIFCITLATCYSHGTRVLTNQYKFDIPVHNTPLQHGIDLSGLSVPEEFHHTTYPYPYPYAAANDEIPERVHEVYGVPVEDEVVPEAVPVVIRPAPIQTVYSYEIPSVPAPYPEAEVPTPVEDEHPILTEYTYELPDLPAPIPVVPVEPHSEYGVPKFEDAIYVPEIEAEPVRPALEYGVPH